MVTATEIDKVLGIARASLENEGAYAFLPEIVQTLEVLSDAFKNGDAARCRKLASGLGRLVSEDIDFMESDLGGVLSDLTDELIK